MTLDRRKGGDVDWIPFSHRVRVCSGVRADIRGDGAETFLIDPQLRSVGSGRQGSGCQQAPNRCPTGAPQEANGANRNYSREAGVGPEMAACRSWT
jgi:hypothetical protein